MAAKKGNKNALKHGIYSRFLAVQDVTDIEGMSNQNVKDELTLSRARLAHALQQVKDASDPKEKLAWDFACRHWTEIIVTTKTKSVEKRETEQMVFNSLIEAVRAANDRQAK